MSPARSKRTGDSQSPLVQKDDNDKTLLNGDRQPALEKGGKHSILIGVVEAKESELRASATSISIKRGDKVKGVLRFDRFEMDWSE